MKSKLLATVLATGAIASATLSNSVNRAEAFPCGAKRDAASTVYTYPDDSSNPFINEIDPRHLGIVAAGIAAISGLFAAGVAVKRRRTAKIVPAIADLQVIHPEVADEFVSTYETVEPVLTHSIPEKTVVMSK